MDDKTPEVQETAKRLDAFVDAAFAFAVTLLVIAGGETATSLAGLQRALGRIPASLAAFALIAMFWLAHRDYGRLTPRRDALSTVLSLAIVFVVLVYVFPLRIVTESAFFWLSRGRLPGADLIHTLDDLRRLFIVYGLGFGLLAALFAWLFAHTAGAGARLSVTPADQVLARDSVEIWSIIAASGLLSALLAAVTPPHLATWMPGMSYWIIPLTLAVRGQMVRRAARRAAKST